MVEDMYQQELKEAEGGAAAEEREERNQSSNSNNSGHQATAQTSTPTTSTATAPPPPPTATAPTTPTTAKRSDTESDPSLVVINRQGFSENQTKQLSSSTTTVMPPNTTSTSEVAPPVSQCFDSELPPRRSMATEDTRRQGSLVGADYGTSSGGADIGSTLIRFGTTAGDVSLTLGLRHAGNMPEKTPFSVRDFGGI